MLVLWMQETQSGPFGPLFLLQISEKTRIARDTMKKVTETVRELALPVVEENGCKLWDARPDSGICGSTLIRTAA